LVSGWTKQVLSNSPRKFLASETAEIMQKTSELCTRSCNSLFGQAATPKTIVTVRKDGIWNMGAMGRIAVCCPWFTSYPERELYPQSGGKRDLCGVPQSPWCFRADKMTSRNWRFRKNGWYQTNTLDGHDFSYLSGCQEMSDAPGSDDDTALTGSTD
jgi:hypothetical protein